VRMSRNRMRNRHSWRCHKALTSSFVRPVIS
jgi:hypothetical protein